MKTLKRVDYIKNWIADYCKSMSKQPDTLVVGISGGIDSSVTSTICALTEKKTIVLSMPIKLLKEQHDLSIEHKNWLIETEDTYSFEIIYKGSVFLVDEFPNSKDYYDQTEEKLEKI